MTKSLIQTSDQGIFSLCGIETKHIFFGNSLSPDNGARKTFLETLVDAI
jgi:hypothetical protein